MGFEAGGGALHASAALRTASAALRTVAARLRSEPSALIAPDDADWHGPARLGYDVMHRVLVHHVDEAIESVEQAQWQIHQALEASHGEG